MIHKILVQIDDDSDTYRPATVMELVKNALQSELTDRNIFDEEDITVIQEQ